jgi:hypothetical protein
VIIDGLDDESFAKGAAIRNRLRNGDSQCRPKLPEKDDAY